MKVIMESSSRSLLMSQEVSPLAPREIMARAEEAETGQNTRLSSGCCSTSCLYSLRPSSLLISTNLFVEESRPLLVTDRPRLPMGAGGILFLDLANCSK